jgi:hypothetical protein
MSEVSNISPNADLYGVQPVESQAPQTEEKQTQETTQKVWNTLYAIFNTITYPVQQLFAEITYNPDTKRSSLLNGPVSPEEKKASDNNTVESTKILEEGLKDLDQRLES